MAETKEKREKNWSVEAFQVVVCREKKLAPFLNVFDFEGISPEQKKLGRLFGAIQIFDYNEKSAYLPNLVAQVIKKEFFKETKRTGEESFESALRKANLALADLASHEIVGWMGKFQAVVGAIQGNDFWFTQSGGGKIILVRKKIANEISLGLDNEESASHPVKTFSNISSGKLEKGDKLIFATETVFEKNRWEEFSRHITVFSSSELDNLLRSTIELEAENAGFVLANVLIGESPLLKKEAPLEENFSSPNLNFFGKKDQPKETPALPAVEKELPKENPLEKTDPESSPFEQEPELYIKENEKEIPQPKEPPSEESPSEILIPEEEEPLPEPEEKFPPSPSVPLKEKLSFWQHPKVQSGFSNLQSLSQTGLKKLDSMKNNLDFSSSKEKIAKFFQKPVSIDEPEQEQEKQEALPSLIPTEPSVLTRFLSIKKNFSKKFWLILSLTLLLVLLATTGWFFVKKGAPFSSSDNLPTPAPASENDTVAPSGNQLKEISSLPEKIVQSTLMKKKLYFLTENNAFYQLENLDQKDPILKKIDLPGEISSVENIAGMDDLNLVFLVTQKQVFAYSPVTGKILPNDIENLPAQKTASFSYLTYLYLLDPSANQISQYPRAGTGFGAKKDWLKESADLAGAIDFSADDSIFLLFSDGKIARYFRGKKTGEFLVEKDGQKIIGKKISASVQGDSLFLLSSEQKSVYQLDKSGKVLNQWPSSQLENAQEMEVDFESKTVFVTTQDQKVVEIKY